MTPVHTICAVSALRIALTKITGMVRRVAPETLRASLGVLRFQGGIAGSTDLPGDTLQGALAGRGPAVPPGGLLEGGCANTRIFGGF